MIPNFTHDYLRLLCLHLKNVFNHEFKTRIIFKITKLKFVLKTISALFGFYILSKSDIIVRGLKSVE